MIPEFMIAPDFTGPTLAELLPCFDEPQCAPAAIEARWASTRADYRALESLNAQMALFKITCALTLVVPDLETQERTIWHLGGRITLPQEEMDTVRSALASKDNQHRWRGRIGDVGYARGTMLLCRVMATAILSKRPPRATTVALASECVLHHQDPADADVLMRLRAAQH